MRHDVKAFSILLLATVLAAPLAPAGDIYTWTDGTGRKVYSDRPPLGVSARAVRASPAAGPSGMASEPVADHRLKTSQPSPDIKAREDEANKTIRQYNCDVSKERLKTLESGVRVARVTPAGEQSFLSDSQRQTEAAEARKGIAEWCNQPGR